MLSLISFWILLLESSDSISNSQSVHNWINLFLDCFAAVIWKWRYLSLNGGTISGLSIPFKRMVYLTKSPFRKKTALHVSASYTLTTLQ